MLAIMSLLAVLLCIGPARARKARKSFVGESAVDDHVDSDSRALRFAGALTKEECTEVRGYTGSEVDGRLSGQQKTDSALGAIRSTKLNWLPRDGSNDWLYKRILKIAKVANADPRWSYEALATLENLQLGVYDADADPPGHYDWHADVGWKPETDRSAKVRILSLSVQLSTETEYEGGDLQIGCCSNMSKVQGTAVVFPSFQLHKVYPVTRGTRASLVAWVHGTDSKRFWEHSSFHPEYVLRKAKAGLSFPPELIYRAKSTIGPIRLQKGLQQPGAANSAELLESALELANEQIALAEQLYGEDSAARDVEGSKTKVLLPYKMLLRYSQAVGDLDGAPVGVLQRTRQNCEKAAQLLVAVDEERQLATQCQTKWAAKLKERGTVHARRSIDL
eukprot:SAG31_NODE_2633_length_5345_cov_70.416317_3_plen_392_part_00